MAPAPGRVMHILGRTGWKVSREFGMVALEGGATRELDRDTLLVTVSCMVDDRYQQRCAPGKPRRSGRRPEMSESAVRRRAVLAPWQHHRSERALPVYAVRHLRQ